MPLLLQICIVVVTTALVGIAFVAMRTMARFERAADAFSVTAVSVQESLEEVHEVTRELHELVNSLSEMTPGVRRTAARLERIGDRTADLTSGLLDEVERPVRMAIALARGVRAGANTLVDRLARRSGRELPKSGTTRNGGYEDA